MRACSLTFYTKDWRVKVAHDRLIIACAAGAILLMAAPAMGQGVVTPDTEPSLKETGINKSSTVLNGSATVWDRSMSTNRQMTNPVGAPGSTASAGRYGDGAKPVPPPLASPGPSP